MSTTYYSLMVAAAFAFIASPATSTTLTFTVTGTDAASFSLDTSSFVKVHLNGPPPLDYDQYDAVPTVYNGASALANISFYDAPSGGGFQVTVGSSYISPIGAVVFKGALDNPIFAPGTFSFTQDYTRGAINDQFVISDGSVAAVPEPATWAMMLIGFLAVGYVLRSRPRDASLPLACHKAEGKSPSSDAAARAA